MNAPTDDDILHKSTNFLRGIIDRPDLELVGLYVYGDKKVGRDAGDR